MQKLSDMAGRISDERGSRWPGTYYVPGNKPNALHPCYSKWGPHTSSLSVTWELIRNAEILDPNPDLLNQKSAL